DRARRALPHRGDRPADPAGRTLRAAMSTGAVTASAIAHESALVRNVMRWAVPIAVLLLVVPWIVPPYTAILLTYGLIMAIAALRSEEHTSELQSRSDLVCRLLLEKKNRVFAATTTSTPTHRNLYPLLPNTIISPMPIW